MLSSVKIRWKKSMYVREWVICWISWMIHSSETVCLVGDENVYLNLKYKPEKQCCVLSYLLPSCSLGLRLPTPPNIIARNLGYWHDVNCSPMYYLLYIYLSLIPVLFWVSAGFVALLAYLGCPWFDEMPGYTDRYAKNQCIFVLYSTIKEDW